MESGDELMKLAGSIAGKLDDKNLIMDVYKSAEAKFSSYNEFVKLAKAVIKDTGDTGFAGELYHKAAGTNPDCSQLTALATALADDIEDKKSALDVLKQAEIAVKTPADFKKTAEAVLKYADDEKWLSDTKLQLEKRETHKDLYAEFVKREQECIISTTMGRLAHDVMEQTGETWELVLVDDGSHDRSAAIIADLHAADSRPRASRSPAASVSYRAPRRVAAGRGCTPWQLEDCPI